MTTFFGPKELVEFKQVEYELNKTYGDVYTKCDSQLSSIAYAFAIRETGNGKGLKQSNKNNLFGLRYGTSKTSVRPKFKNYPIKNYTPAGYNVYDSRTDSIYDFMNQFYLSGCKLTKGYIKGHKNGKNGGNEGVEDYYKFIKNQQTKYNNKVKERFIVKGIVDGSSLGLQQKELNIGNSFGVTIIDTRDMSYSILSI